MEKNATSNVGGIGYNVRIDGGGGVWQTLYSRGVREREVFKRSRGGEVVGSMAECAGWSFRRGTICDD